MTQSVQGLSASDANAARIQSSLQDFVSGKTNITKKDLKDNIIAIQSQGQQPESMLLELYDSYDKIDKNGDGISYKEFETYKSSPAGILNSLGLNSKYNMSRGKLVTSMATALLNTSNKQTGLSGMLQGNTSTSGSSKTGSSTSYMNSIMQNYLQANSSTNTNSYNLADYLS